MHIYAYGRYYRNTYDTQEIRDRLNTLNGKTFIHWVPSHINIPGNEMADKAAKDAAKMNSEEGPVPVSFEVARAVVKRTFVDPEPQHPVVAGTYKEVSTKKDNIVSNRRDLCLLAQLRSGTASNWLTILIELTRRHLQRVEDATLSQKQSSTG